MNNIAPRANKFIIEALVGRRAAYDAKIKYEEERIVLQNIPQFLTDYCYIEEVDPLAYIIDILEDAGYQNAYAIATIPFIKLNMYSSNIVTSANRQYELIGKMDTRNQSQTFLRLALSRYFRVYLSTLNEDTTLARFCLGSSDYWPEYYKYFKEIIAPILVRTNFDVHEFSKIAQFTGLAEHPDSDVDADLRALYLMDSNIIEVPGENCTMYENLTKQQVDRIKNLVLNNKDIIHLQTNPPFITPIL